MRKFILALATITASATQAFCQGGTQEFLTELTSKEPLNTCLLGVKAQKLSGEVLVDFNSERKLIPASNTKLISTGLALNLLGGDYRFSTIIACDGEIKDSTLYGDIYVIGEADPTLATELQREDSFLGEWASIIRNAGIAHITGSIIGDARYFDGYSIHGDWCFGDVGYDYGAAPSGLNWNEGRKLIKVYPGESVGAPAIIQPDYPETPWMRYRVSATTSAPGSGSNLEYNDTPLAPFGEVTGYISYRHKGRSLSRSNLFGAYTCAYHFYKYLTENGFTVGGGYADVDCNSRIRTDLLAGDTGRSAAAQTVELGRTYSPELREIIRHTNYESDNFYAETLLRAMTRMLTGSACYDSCATSLPQALSTIGITEPYNAIQVDGSGLARKNMIAPEFFVQFLLAMTYSRCFEDYVMSLPYPGKGTLSYRFRGCPYELANRIRMKTGSMGGVNSASGYILPQDGNPDNIIAFSVIFNNFTISATDIRTIIDAIVMQIATES